MNKIKYIIAREYLTRVRTRVFIVTTLLMPLFILIPVALPLLISNYASSDQKIAVLDQSGIFAGKLENKDHVQFSFVNESYDSLKQDYAYEGYNGILYVPSSFSLDDPKGIEYFSTDQLGLGTSSDVSDALTKVATRARLTKVNVTPELIDQLSKQIHFDTITGNKASNAGSAYLFGFFVGFLLYLVMVIYGVMVMRGVIEEKSNRIAEVIVSSVRPFQLMMGKIVGIALVGLTQFAAWIVLAAIGISVIHSVAGTDVASAAQSSGNGVNFSTLFSGVSNLPLPLILAGTIFFFLFGYLMYASLFAAIGSAAGEETDQSLSFIGTMPIIISFLIMTSILNDPNSHFAVICSLIPFFAPIVMTARLAFDPPLWQVLLSMVLLIATFLGMVWAAGKIYRTGILLYGKKTSLREMVKWVRY